MVVELLNLYVCCVVCEGYVFLFDLCDYVKFVESFGFEEMFDQVVVIVVVIGDMMSGKLMDCFVCGDVGFGKIEVVLCVVFIVVLGGKQVVLLLLIMLFVEQYMQIFVDCFVDWLVCIVELLCFKIVKEVNVVIVQINEGSVDIVIGMYKLLLLDVQFKCFGFVIIDEEYCFGVCQKEVLKVLCVEVDVLMFIVMLILCMFGMVFEGLCDFLVIVIVLQKWFVIKIFVCCEEESVICEVMLCEFKCGGQVYFLYNEVEMIENCKVMFEVFVFEVCIVIVYGQMYECEFECVMCDFVVQCVNVLLCMIIIEIGIDVLSVNMIIMYCVDKFGFVQFYQLCGCVGCLYYQVYVYLLVYDLQLLIKQVQCCLEVIQQMEEFGLGFYFVMYDFEICGIGEVFGDKQLGEIYEIGFQFYMDMLNDVVKVLKNGKEFDFIVLFVVMIEINLYVFVILLVDYCVDVQEWLLLYKWFVNCEYGDVIDGIQEELIDCFGKLLLQVYVFVEMYWLWIVVKLFGIVKIDVSEVVIGLQFELNLLIDLMWIIEMVQKYCYIKFVGQDKLCIEMCLFDFVICVLMIKEMLCVFGLKQGVVVVVC